MKIIIGLGNPGKEFEKTRHNIGFEIIDNLSEKLGIKSFKKENNGITSSGTYLDNKFLLIKPQTFMNNSGECVAHFSRYFKVDPQKIIVVYDDINLPIGTVRLRKNGSSGGHNGIKSVINHLKSDQFSRLKIGIGYDKIIQLKD
jgi:PTH1 family peptidyl-tRNA hydrolase